MKKNKRIALLNDFGAFYSSIMKGVIWNIAPGAQIIDITHEVAGHNIIEGAFLLREAGVFFQNSIFVAVIDPGVGSERKALAIKAGDLIFIGPDNGLLIPAARSLNIEMEVYEITRFSSTSTSSTFHGRDIFAPAAAYLYKSSKIDEIGDEIEDFVDLDLSFDGSPLILHIDRFGNVITNIPGSAVEDREWVMVNNRKIPIFNFYFFYAIIFFFRYFNCFKINITYT